MIGAILRIFPNFAMENFLQALKYDIFILNIGLGIAAGRSKLYG